MGGTIDRGVLRMETLIRDLVDAARIERGEFLVSTHDERIDAIVQEAVDALAPLASERSIALEASVEKGEAVVSCDRDRLLQAIGNLLGNAIKFTPVGEASSCARMAASIQFVSRWRTRALGSRPIT